MFDNDLEETDSLKFTLHLDVCEGHMRQYVAVSGYILLSST